MGKVVVGMTMSLDGFVNDRNGSVQALYPDLSALRDTGALLQAIETTGAVVMGKRAFAMGEPDAYADAYEFQVPIFVLTHHVPQHTPKRNDKLYFTFVTDGIASAIAQAKAAAGDKHVAVIGGASVAQQVINAGLCDEIQVGIMPVLLGEGLRFLPALDTGQVELEKIKVMESPDRTDIWYRVSSNSG